ncbi:MAG: hypothetical protein IT427_03495 [Pirellulales bacterium]|nr:hypothetical protein [Pirellulales bacterium]
MARDHTSQPLQRHRPYAPALATAFLDAVHTCNIADVLTAATQRGVHAPSSPQAMLAPPFHGGVTGGVTHHSGRFTGLLAAAA